MTDLNQKKKDYLNWNDIENLVKKTSLKIKEYNKEYDLIIGIKNGGIIPAKLISRELNINDIDFISVKRNQIFTSSNFPRNKKYLMIDDIYDTGKTFLTVNKLASVCGGVGDGDPLVLLVLSFIAGGFVVCMPMGVFLVYLFR